MKIGMKIGVALIICAAPVLAHDGGTSATIDDWLERSITHTDASPFKGLFTLTVTNTSQSNYWGDFHFAINGASQDASLVLFEASPVSSSQTPFTSVVGTDTMGMSTLDLYFYDDPVGPGETAEFTVYTDNTAAANAWFGICFWPTPVPEPSSLLILGMGGVLIARRRIHR